MPGERFLVHGPGLRELTDFLYFDRIVYPVTTASLRSRTLPPGYAGYRLREPLPDDVRGRLAEAGLLTSPGALIAAPDSGELGSQLAQGPEAFLASMQQSMIAAGATLGKIAFSTLEMPASDAEVVGWVRELDANAKTLADLARTRGRRVTVKLHAEDVTWTLRPGWTSVLCLTFHRLPRLRAGPDTLGDVLAFLGDEETRRRRQQLFDWHDGVESAIARGEMSLPDIPARIASRLAAYREWIAASRLSSGTMTAELLVALDEALVHAVAALEAPTDQVHELRLGRRGLSLEGDGSGRELAYICHARKNIRSLWPG